MTEEIEPVDHYSALEVYQGENQFKKRYEFAWQMARHTQPKLPLTMRYRRAIRMLGLELLESDKAFEGESCLAPPLPFIGQDNECWEHTARVIWRQFSTEDRKRRRIVCSAVQNCNGAMVLGIRHFGIEMQDTMFQHHDKDVFFARNKTHSGFIDNFGIFLTRQEAFPIAEAANQFLADAKEHSQYRHKKLFSEMLF